MAPLAIQVGDWATRLRRALGLRGDLGYQLGSPIATPTVKIFDLTEVPYADEPEHWAFSPAVAIPAGGAATYATAVLTVPSGIAVLDDVQATTPGGSTFWSLFLERPQITGIGSAYVPALKTNPKSTDTALPGSYVYAVPQVATLTPASIGRLGLIFTGLDYWGPNTIPPTVLRPGDALVLSSFTANAALTFNMRGRWFPDRS